jgi:hypothetical protein
MERAKSAISNELQEAPVTFSKTLSFRIQDSVQTSRVRTNSVRLVRMQTTPSNKCPIQIDRSETNRKATDQLSFNYLTLDTPNLIIIGLSLNNSTPNHAKYVV